MVFFPTVGVAAGIVDAVALDHHPLQLGAVRVDAGVVIDAKPGLVVAAPVADIAVLDDDIVHIVVLAVTQHDAVALAAGEVEPAEDNVGGPGHADVARCPIVQ